MSRIALPEISIDARIEDALRSGARIDFSTSGGKDSSAAATAVTSYLDSIGHPRSHRSATHADLGLIEWPQTRAHIHATMNRLGLSTTIVGKAGGLIERWRQRFELAKARYIELQTYQLIGPFSSSSLRFCTAEQKVAPIRQSLAARFPRETIITVLGIRTEESANRARAPISRIDVEPSLRSGRPKIISWNPILTWTLAQVIDIHRQTKTPLHYAYTQHQMTRLSCSACVLQSAADMRNSILSGLNDAAIDQICEIEIASGFSFQPARWITSMTRPDHPQRAFLAAAQHRATERRAAEAAMPPDLRYAKGWPPRIPDLREARIIGETRALILAQHDLPRRFIKPAEIVDRFAQLHRDKHPTRRA